MNEVNLPLDQKMLALLLLLLLLLWVIRPRTNGERTARNDKKQETVETTSQDLNPEYGRYIQLGMRG